MPLRKRTLAIGALAAGVAPVAGVFAFQAMDSDSDPAPASAAGEVAQPSNPPGGGCTNGLQIAPLLRASQDVACDLSSGFIGMRGGFCVSNAPAGVELPSLRPKLDEGEMHAFLKSTGSSGLEAIDLDVDEAQFTEQGCS